MTAETEVLLYALILLFGLGTFLAGLGLGNQAWGDVPPDEARSSIGQDATLSK